MYFEDAVLTVGKDVALEESRLVAAR